MISARHDSTLPNGPADGSHDTDRPGGHTEKYSPPGPNLHTGSIRLFLYASILDTSHFRGFPMWVACAMFYRPCLPRNPNKNRTKLGPCQDFFRLPAPAPSTLYYMGRELQIFCLRTLPGPPGETNKTGRYTEIFVHFGRLTLQKSTENLVWECTVMNGHSHVTVRKHSFLSSTAFGLSAIVITVIVSATVVLLYAVHLASDKSERIITLAQSAVRSLPEFQQALPPALADMLNDRRQPDYAGQLAITAKVTAQPGSNGRSRTAIEIVNNGNQVVSLLSLRVVLLDEHDELLCESQEWAATPVAVENDWRGPLMPGSKRRFVCSRSCPYDVGPLDVIKPEIEITELRVWNASEEAGAHQEAPNSPPVPAYLMPQ